MSSLFSWVWDLLYAISKSMYAIIDNLLACANMLCGIEPIQYQGVEMDFLSFLMRNSAISLAFVGAVIVGVVLVVIFGVASIIRTMVSEKTDKTPAQIFVAVGKTMLTFLFIPAELTVLIVFTNIIMQVMYQSTLGNSKGLGSFLAGAFGQNALKGGVSPDFYLDPSFDYTSTSNMKNYVHLDDYDYFFSWIACLAILFSLGPTLLMFVDRAISIIVLFIVAPISLSTSVLDDGARFKLWRDQFLVKFLTGYGAIIGINIYALIVAAICNDGLVFFDNTILNNMMKILIVVGGGVSLNRIMALIGNIVSQGAGSNELRDSAIAANSFKNAAMGGMRAAFMPFKATRGAINFARDVKNTGLGTTLGRRLGFKTDRDYAIEQGRVNRGGGDGGNGNNKKPGAGGSDSMVRNIIGGANPSGEGGIGGGANPGAGGGNQAANAIGGGQNPGGNMVNNAVKDALDGAKDEGGNKK